MKKNNLLTLLMSFTSVLTQAQQDLFRTSQIISPEIHKNNTVTFRLLAPNARSVTLSGDWIPAL